MQPMPRPRPPHLLSERTRHGKTVWYVRIGRGARVRIRGDYGSPEFMAAYHAAVTGAALPTDGARRRVKSGSLAWAIDLYRQSSAWQALSAATRRQRDNIFHRIIETAGAEPLASITRAVIIAGRERRAATPFAAKHFIDTMRGLFVWAVDSQIAASDPTQGVKVAKPKTGGFEPWTHDDIAAFEARWPLGTRERVAFAVLLYTGLRRGDAAQFGRQHIRDGVARVRTEKTSEVAVFVIEPPLLEAIEAGPCGDLSFIARHDGRPMVKEGFGNWFGEACRAAGVKKSAHGLRKAGATRDAEAGYTESELEAKYGWSGGRMASKYTRAMNRERLAIGASNRVKLLRDQVQTDTTDARVKKV